MKVTIFEVCRSPEVKKITEPVILSRFFSARGIEYELYSNDGIWPKPVTITKNFITERLQSSQPEIVHLAMHGNDDRFILKWSNDGMIQWRVPEDILTGPEILTMPAWQGKLVISGACNTAKLASYFLDAGARAVIAPELPVIWAKLGQFFCVFYEAIFSGRNLEQALQLTLDQFPTYWCYKLYQKQES